MRELKHDELRMRLDILISTAPKYATEASGAFNYVIANHLMKFLFDGLVLVSPSFAERKVTDTSPVHGEFGVTEPHPLVLEKEVVALRAEVERLTAELARCGAAPPAVSSPP